jgi:hypothetical protein
MSPVARSQRHAGKALLVAGVGVAVAIGLAFAMSVLANRGTVKVNLGDDVFDAGDADDLAEHIDEGGPLLFSDIAGGSRDIFISHEGDDLETGWFAFDARTPGASRDCSVEWKADDEVFVDPCTDDELPADGTGLPQYKVTVTEGGNVEVDLRKDD